MLVLNTIENYILHFYLNSQNSMSFKMKYFNEISNFKFNKIYLFINKTPLHLAIEKGNYKIIEFLLSKDYININYPYIYIQYF